MAKQLQNVATHLRAIAIILTMLILGTGIVKAAETDAIGVRVVIDDASTYYETTHKTVGEFLASESIEVEESDIINVDLEEDLKNAMRIVITKPFEVDVFVDGEEFGMVETNVENIGQLVLQMNEQNDIEFRTAEGLSSATKLERDMEVQLLSVKYEENVVTEPIEFEEVTVDTDELFTGETRVKQEGAQGSTDITMKSVFVSGELEQTYEINRVVTKEPVDKIIEVGTKVKVVEEAKPVATNKITAPNGAEASKVLVMNASGYCPCSKCCGSYSNGYTANGMKAQNGVVAVDTRVIPLGTKLYVEGYGYCVAADKGSAIKGNKIDLCFSSHSQALTFGRKNVKVYVLS